MNLFGKRLKIVYIMNLFGKRLKIIKIYRIGKTIGMTITINIKLFNYSLLKSLGSLRKLMILPKEVSLKSSFTDFAV